MVLDIALAFSNANALTRGFHLWICERAFFFFLSFHALPLFYSRKVFTEREATVVRKMVNRWRFSKKWFCPDGVVTLINLIPFRVVPVPRWIFFTCWMGLRFRCKRFVYEWESGDLNPTYVLYFSSKKMAMKHEISIWDFIPSLPAFVF